jgi:hypothetical protein
LISGLLSIYDVEHIVPTTAVTTRELVRGGTPRNICFSFRGLYGVHDKPIISKYDFHRIRLCGIIGLRIPFSSTLLSSSHRFGIFFIRFRLLAILELSAS